MKSKVKNIRIAIAVCIISFILFAIFHFTPSNIFLRIGNRLEDILGHRTNIDVDRVSSFVVTIMSGIFASSLVALFFYIQEYQNEKKALYKRIITVNNQMIEKYNKIPSMSYSGKGEFNALARAYYVEYYNNKQSKELEEESERFIRKVPKSYRRALREDRNVLIPKLEDKYEKQLIQLLRDKPENIPEIDGVKISEHAVLRDIILNMDYQLENAYKIYKEIQNIDLIELKSLADEVDTFHRLRKLQKYQLMQMINDEKILPALKENSKLCLAKLIVNRMIEINERIQRFITTQYEKNEIVNLKPYDKEALIISMLWCEWSFLDKVESKIVQTDKQTYFFTYNKLAYGLSNLNSLLWCDLTHEYAKYEKTQFVLKKDEYKNGVHLYSHIFDGQDMNPNIFR